MLTCLWSRLILTQISFDYHTNQFILHVLETVFLNTVLICQYKELYTRLQTHSPIGLSAIKAYLLYMKYLLIILAKYFLSDSYSTSKIFPVSTYFST